MYHTAVARRWTAQEEQQKFAELQELYVRQNKTIDEVGVALRVAPQTVFDRLVRLGIPTCRQDKASYAAQRRNDVRIPSKRTPALAEFFGIMLGDGHISYYQVAVTLGTKEFAYVRYVTNLIGDLFGVTPTTLTLRNGYHTVYVGSRELVEWLRVEGLVNNKVKEQVGVPGWIYETPEYMVRFLRGFFDTDGSVYRLRFGIQIEFTNHSLPLLDASRDILIRLGYHPSVRSGYKVYLTRRPDIMRFFADVMPANEKHVRRFEIFARR